MGINWDELLSGNYIKLTDGEPKTMVLTKWREQDKFKDDNGNLRKGITFDVTEEDGAICKDNDGQPKAKEWTVTAIRAMAKLRPIVEKAEKMNKDTIKISVVRVGEGKKTEYSIKELEA